MFKHQDGCYGRTTGFGLFAGWRIACLLASCAFSVISFKAQGAFCFSNSASKVCQLSQSTGSVEVRENLGEVDPYIGVEFDNIDLAFRACTSARGCVRAAAGDALPGQITFERITLTGPTSARGRSLTESDYYFGHRRARSSTPNSWQLHKTITEPASTAANGVAPLDLLFSLKKEWLAKAAPGNYQIRIDLRGTEKATRARAGKAGLWRASLLMAFTVGANVEISGLDDIDFGTFLNTDVTEPQTDELCVYSQAGLNFDVKADSKNTDSSDSFWLEGGTPIERVGYIVFFDPKTAATTPSHQLMEGDWYTSGTDLVGDPKQDCPSGDNMRLTVQLAEDFSTLSTLPAGTYSDELTLTVRAH